MTEQLLHLWCFCFGLELTLMDVALLINHNNPKHPVLSPATLCQSVSNHITLDFREPSTGLASCQPVNVVVLFYFHLRKIWKPSLICWIGLWKVTKRYFERHFYCCTPHGEGNLNVQAIAAGLSLISCFTVWRWDLIKSAMTKRAVCWTVSWISVLRRRLTVCKPFVWVSGKSENVAQRRRACVCRDLLNHLAVLPLEQGMNTNGLLHSGVQLLMDMDTEASWKPSAAFYEAACPLSSINRPSEYCCTLLNSFKCIEYLLSRIF